MGGGEGSVIVIKVKDPHTHGTADEAIDVAVKKGCHVSGQPPSIYQYFHFPPTHFHSTIMASGSNPQLKRKCVEDDDHVVPSMPQKGTPSSTQLANIPEQAFKEASKYLRKTISPEDSDESDIMLRIVWLFVHDALENDPNLKGQLASKEEFLENVIKKGERKFANTLRTMAANSDTQGSDAWKDLFDDGQSFVFFSLIVLILFYV